MKVCVTRNIPGPAVALLKEQGFDVSVSLRDHALTRPELLEFVRGADALITLLTDKVDAEVFEASGPQLKIVANYAIGFDNIDLTEAARRKIPVTNTPSEIITISVAEHTLALILVLAKKILPADKFVRSDGYHGWDPNLFLGTQLLGKNLGIIGLGRIGTMVAKAASAGLQMKVLYTGPNRKEEFEKECGGTFATLAELLGQSDFVTLHVPLTPETHHLINAEKLYLMKKTAFLINTSRGPVVEEAALIGALKTRQIAGAGLDVFESEGEINSQFYGLENAILTPHIASATKEAREKMSRLAAENVIAVLSGRKALNPAFISS